MPTNRHRLLMWLILNYDLCACFKFLPSRYLLYMAVNKGEHYISNFEIISLMNLFHSFMFYEQGHC